MKKADIEQAKCVGTGDPEEFHVLGAAQGLNKTFCTGCPVIQECLAEALDDRIEWGVWGGMTERERRALLKSFPGITSWRDLFEADRLREEAKAEKAEAKRLEANFRAYSKLKNLAAGR